MSGWQEGGWDAGDIVRWRGVRLICTTGHYAGDKAEHPWDPGWGWPAQIAATLWRPLGWRDRLLLRIVARHARGALETLR